MQKTLGGDRLGSGNKMKVNLHGYERSTHDKGYIMRTTMSSGTLVPFISELALPGDTFDINLNVDVKTHPTIGPLFGSYKVQLDVFQAPIRLYNAMLHNNALNIGRNMSQIKLPQIELTAPAIADASLLDDLDNAQVNPSSLVKYLGISGIGLSTTGGTRQFNACNILAYWDIYKNYYANKQEEIGAVIHTPNVTLISTVDFINVINSGASEVLPEQPTTGITELNTNTEIEVTFTGATPLPNQIMIDTSIWGIKSLEELTLAPLVITGATITGTYNFAQYGPQSAFSWRYITDADLGTKSPTVATFPLDNIDKMRQAILAHDNTVFLINDENLTPYNWLHEQPSGFPNILNTQEGLAVKTYQSDLFNNWVSTEWIDGTGGITEITSIDVSGGLLVLDTLNIQKKVYNYLMRIAVSGGSYQDWLDVTWDEERHWQCESPMYMGGLIKELVFQEVVSNSESAEGTQPLGTLAGKGVMAKKHKGGNIRIKVEEPSYIIGIISLTPRIDYSQGNNWDMQLKTMDDFHKPALDQIGFQELITEQFAWWSTSENLVTPNLWIQKSAGKQPAWLNYMTNVNKCYGNFAVASNEMFMTLNRRYEYDDTSASDIKDLTTYIDPVKYNQIFAQTSLDAQNFWTQIGVDMQVRRKMSAKLMPNI